MQDIHNSAPVDPSVLADAILKLDNLRLAKNPSSATSPNVSGNTSGASSPNAGGVTGATGFLGLKEVTPVIPPEGRAVSVPGTPHFGAQTDL